MEGLCAKALADAVFESLLVRPSRSTFEAAVAAVAEVTFLGAFVCDNALPAAVLDFGAVLAFVRVFDALEAAFEPVTFVFVINISLQNFTHARTIPHHLPQSVSYPPKKINNKPLSFF